MTIGCKNVPNNANALFVRTGGAIVFTVWIGGAIAFAVRIEGAIA
ncbi:MAG: hypothetical protein WBA57_00305 [Elainellaceae cyanobacterium]